MIKGRWAWRFWVMPAAFVLVTACDSPEQRRFVDMCVSSGDSEQRCACTYKVLEAEAGTIDQEFVSFIVDFVKWDVPPGERGLSRAQLKEKYELSDEGLRQLTEKVGHTMLRAMDMCSRQRLDRGG